MIRYKPGRRVCFPQLGCIIVSGRLYRFDERFWQNLDGDRTLVRMSRTIPENLMNRDELFIFFFNFNQHTDRAFVIIYSLRLFSKKKLFGYNRPT